MAMRRASRRVFISFGLYSYRSISSTGGAPFPPPPIVSSRRVVVTGLGMVTPLGCGVDKTWKHLIDGKCGVRALCLEDLKMNGFDRETQLSTFEQLTSKVAAVVPTGTNPGEFNEEMWLNSKDHRSIARFIAYALCAADEALKDSNWFPIEQEHKERTGVSIGGGTGSVSDILDSAQLICEKRLRRLSPFFIPRILINMASGHVSMKYGFQGPNHAAVTACATGSHSIGDAMRMIQFGDADVMVAGGTESSIDALSIAGFCRSRALTTKYNSSPQEASRPFDSGRDGIGEGSGVLVLEEFEHAKNRGAKIYAEVRGYGMSGDAIEANAMKTIFSDRASSSALAFSSTKGAIGHLLGAAGAVEAIFAVLAIKHGIAPLTLNLTKPDPVFSDGFMPLTASEEMPIRVAMSNSFGFGGTNASLLFAYTGSD
ncbi:Thiolase-like [Sesbania bispinosa]|nr:Thiolase-like [Sesbania bispinosa]